MNSSKIIGVGEFLPGEPVTNAMIESHFGLRADWIDLVIGTKARHFAVDLDSREVRHRLVDLCAEAARRALEMAQLSAAELDLIVLSTATPDQLMPSTVNMIAERLGANEVATYQIQAGCAGSMQALALAKSLLEGGGHGHALVMSGDTAYKFLERAIPTAELQASELINLALFGDGAGAAVLTTSRRRAGITVGHIINRFEGNGVQAGHELNWAPPWTPSASSEDSAPRAQSAREDYKAIEERVPLMAKEVMDELLSAAGCGLSDVQFVLPPQLAGRITDRIMSVLGVDPARCLSRVADVGNTGNATPYFQLTELWERMKPRDSAILIAIESSKWLKTGLFLTRTGEA